MARQPKQIRKVDTGTGVYYVYDLDADAFGKRKRLYGKTEGEVKAKIEAALNEKQTLAEAYRPKSNKLSEYVVYYIRHAASSISFKEINRYISLFERAVFSSEIDKDLDKISAQEITNFYKRLATKFSLEQIADIDNILRKTYQVASIAGIVPADFFEANNIKLPTEEDVPQISNFQSYKILSPKDYDTFLKFCIADNYARYGENILVITLLMMTGLKVSFLKQLCAKDVDLENACLHFKDESIPLSEQAVNWLSYQKEQERLPLNNPDDTQLLFLNERRSASPSLQSMQYTLNRLTARCGFEKGVTLSSLCKSYVIYEYENGTLPSVIRARANLKKESIVTDIYEEYRARTKLFGSDAN